MENLPRIGEETHFPPRDAALGYLVVMLFVFLAQLCWILKQGPQIKHGIDFKIGKDCI